MKIPNHFESTSLHFPAKQPGSTAHVPESRRGLCQQIGGPDNNL